MTGSVETFEKKLAEFTGAPYVVTTDCCTHAIELCFRLLQIKTCRFSAHTYISVPMTMKLLDVDYELSVTPWKDEYQFLGTPVWDSVRGGAILLDDKEHYEQLKMMSYDGRDLSYSNWIDQKVFRQGFHYMMRYEECESATVLLENYISAKKFEHTYKPYPDIRKVDIV